MAPPVEEREFFIDNLLVRIHLIIVMILVERSCAMGVEENLATCGREPRVYQERNR